MISENIWSAYLRSGDLSVCLRNGSKCLSVCIICQELTDLGTNGQAVWCTRKNVPTWYVATHLYTSDHVLVMSAERKLVRLCELIRSPWPIDPSVDILLHLE